jgi:hypothetical protein
MIARLRQTMLMLGGTNDSRERLGCGVCVMGMIEDRSVRGPVDGRSLV